MVDVSEAPIVEVHLDNYKELWPSLVLAIQSSTFVAIDTVSIICITRYSNTVLVFALIILNFVLFLFVLRRLFEIMQMHLYCYMLRLINDFKFLLNVKY